MKLSLRDLFWLTAVVACLCGWWREHRRVVQAGVAFERVSADRTLWVERAKDAKGLLSNQGYVLTYYIDGLSLESKDRADQGGSLIDIASEEAKPEQVSFPK